MSKVLHTPTSDVFRLTSFLSLTLALLLALPAAAETPVPSPDPTSAYTPTAIINGDFATFPWMDFTYGGVRYTDGFFQSVNNVTVHPNGVDGGWNTTETSVWNATGSLYDNFYDADPSTGSGYPKRSDGKRTLGYVNTRSSSDNCGSASLYGKGQNIFIEMNASHADTLYQDLTTHGNDVIRWTLKHAARTSADADTYQPITVLIGAPQVNGSSIVYPSGTDAKIVASTLGSYNYEGCSGTCAYANVSELASLRLNKSTQSGAWYTASGVYMIPEGQSVTRFAFRSDAANPSAGNFLDDLTFSTLIGNLGAKANADGSVTVTGYWGDADAAKKLCVKIGANVLQLTMAGVPNNNFTVTIPAETIADAAQIEVYHQDYEQAKRTVKIQHPAMYRVLVEDGALKAYCTNTAHTVAGGCDHAGEANEIAVSVSAKSAPYTGAPYTRAKLTGETDKWAAAGLDLALVYVGRGETSYGPSVTAPTAAGTYTAKAVSGLFSVSSDFDIMRIAIGEGEQIGDLIKLPVKVDGAMTLYSVSVSGARLRITAASGAGWKFQDAVKSVKEADPTPIVGTDYLAISLVIDKSAIGATTVAAVAEEALATLRYTKVVAEVKISGSYLGEGVALKAGDYFLNGHFYTLSSDCQYWDKSMEWSFNLMSTDPDRYPGYKSYPVVITSREENDLLVNIWANAHAGYKTQVWLPSVPKNFASASATVTVGGTEGNRTVTVTGVPLAAENDNWTRNGKKQSGGTYGMGERYVWMTGVPEAGLPLPAETNLWSNQTATTGEGNGIYWSCENPSNRGVNYFGHPNFGAVWDDLEPNDEGYHYNAWTAFKNNSTVFHLYGLAEWEPKDPETVVTVSDTAKMVPVTFASVSEGTTRGGAAFSSTNTVRKVGSAGAIPVLAKDDCTFLGWTTKSGGSSVVEKTSAEIAAIDPAIGAAGETWYAVWSDVLTLGEFAPLTQLFPEAVGTTGNKYPQITIMLTREKVRADETVTLPDVTGYEKDGGLSTAYSFVIKVSPAKTVAEIATNYLAKIKFEHVVNQEVRVVIGPTTTYKTFYNIDTEHYYQYVPFNWQTSPKTWVQSYNEAKAMSYAGRRGYLATVTSTNEDAFIYAAASEVGWLGGTHLKPGTKNGQYYDNFTTSDNESYWYWACGPECGERFYNSQTTGSRQTYYDNLAAGYYFNWNDKWGGVGEPNGGINENCLTTLRTGTGFSTYPKISNYSWNDIIWNRNDHDSTYMPRGYFVEFGDKKIGDTSDDDPTIASASGYVIATAIIKAPYVEFNAWGGYHGDDPTCEVTSNVCVDGIYSIPVDPTRAGEYEFGGWYASWTNGAAQAIKDAEMFVQGPHTLYAKWTSKSSPEPEDPSDPKSSDGTIEFDPVATNADGSAVIGAGALINRATNAFTKTDLALPEFTSNGPNGIPYVIVRDHAFAYVNYDGLRVEEAKAAAKAAGKKRPTVAEQHTNCLSSVTISTYVTNIQSYAFAECTVLTNVTFSQTRDYLTGAKTNLVIGDWAFANSSVSSVVFPADTRVILDVGAFADAPNLEDIYILGDVSVKGKYPFAGVGRDLYYRTGRTAKVHLSAKLAASPEYVLALTNGMSAVTVVLSDEIVGTIMTTTLTPGRSWVSFTFTVETDSSWLKVTKDTLYCFWATTPDGVTVGTGNVKKPTTLTGPNASGEYTATFDMTDAPGACFFKLAIGDRW